MSKHKLWDWWFDWGVTDKQGRTRTEAYIGYQHNKHGIQLKIPRNLTAGS
jgi:hypothetical protein